MMIMAKDEAKWAYWEKHIKAWHTTHSSFDRLRANALNRTVLGGVL